MLRVSSNQSVFAVIQAMDAAHVSYALVYEQQQFLGLFTAHQLLSAIARGINLNTTPVAELLSSPALSISTTEAQDWEQVKTRFRQHALLHLPVLSATGEVEQVLTPLDGLMAAAARQVESEPIIAAFNHAAVGISLVEPHTGRFLQVNPKLCEMLGYSAEELVGLTCHQVTHPQDRQIHDQQVQQLLRHEADVCHLEKRSFRKDGQSIVTKLTISLAPVNPETATATATELEAETEIGTGGYFVNIAEDITAAKQQEQQRQAVLQEKDLLLQEVHHRVKNNLQVIISLLELQTRRLADPEMQAQLMTSRDRIYSMLLVHQHLRQGSTASRINFTEYVRTLTENLIATYALYPERIQYHLHIEGTIDVNQTTICGLILNELITNAIRHGFQQPAADSTAEMAQPVGHIDIQLRPLSAQQLRLSVTNNGNPLPPDFQMPSPNSMGLRLVSLLIQELQGTVAVERSLHPGFHITFPNQLSLSI
jgi:PAS domain S-box-containing protein